MRIVPCFALATALLVSACQTASNTPSGSPEVTLNGMRPEQAKSRLVDHMLNKGLRLKSDSAYAMTFERPWPNAVASGLAAVLVTSNVSEPAERLQITIAETSAGTRIVADRYMVLEAGSRRERANPANNAPGLVNLQAFLNETASEIRR